MKKRRYEIKKRRTKGPVKRPDDYDEYIKEKEVRLLSETKEQLGVMETRKALSLAKEKNLNLVLISKNANPPVAQILDYGKYKYNKQKHEKEVKKNQKVIQIKEIRLSASIEENDMNTKEKIARKFLESGNQVKVSLRFKGRQMGFQEQGKSIMELFADKLSDIAKIGKDMKLEGRVLGMTLYPLKS